MKKQLISFLAVAFFIGLPVLVTGADIPAMTYSETLPQSAFEKGNPVAAVRMLLKEGVPLSGIIKGAKKSGLSQDAIVAALLDAGVSGEKVVLFCLQGPLSFKRALPILDEYGVSPDKVLVWLITWETGVHGVRETCDYMLKHGYSQVDLLTIMSEAGAERHLVVQVVRWFKIPPAAVIAVYQTFLDYFGHVFNRQSLPQPALLSIGVGRITIEERGRKPLSPMIP